MALEATILLLLLLLALPCAHAESGVYDIDAFGAVPDNGTLEASLAGLRQQLEPLPGVWVPVKRHLFSSFSP
ncbi:hypothetical protein DIPPA_18688 [Diplonema papillatum]|nr:hypothetical protein DIPPA_18688 [Diplonema papillatum]